MKDNGWIKLHRNILNWEWYSDLNTRVVFIHLLLITNFEDGNFKGIKVKKGQCVTSLRSLSKKTGLTIQCVRGALNRLLKTHEITQSATPKYTVITINNWGTYQDINTVNNTVLTQSLTQSDKSNNGLTKPKNERVKKSSNTVTNTDIRIYNNNNIYNNITSNITEYITLWNELFNTKYKAIKPLEANYKYWRETYSQEEILQAIRNYKANQSKHWAKDATPELFLRTMTRSREKCDYIGELLNRYNKKSKFDWD